MTGPRVAAEISAALESKQVLRANTEEPHFPMDKAQLMKSNPIN
jgi:hypothetical protein